MFFTRKPKMAKLREKQMCALMQNYSDTRDIHIKSLKKVEKAKERALADARHCGTVRREDDSIKFQAEALNAEVEIILIKNELSLLESALKAVRNPEFAVPYVNGDMGDDIFDALRDYLLVNHHASQGAEALEEWLSEEST